MKMAKYNDLLVPEGKTWREALEYYNNIFKADLSKYSDIKAEFKEYHKIKDNERFILQDIGFKNKYEQDVPTDLQILKDIEQEHELNLPEELIDLYVNHGSFSINKEYGFFVFKPQMEHYYKYQFENYPYYETFVSETDTLSPSQYDNMEKRFFFWGLGFYDDDGANSIMFYYDNVQKNFGEIVLLTDDCPKMEKKYFPALLAGELPQYTLDELISRQVNRVLLVEILLNPNDALIGTKDLEIKDRELFDGDLLRLSNY